MPLLKKKPDEWKDTIASGSYGYVHEVDRQNGKEEVEKINYVEKTLDFIGSWREMELFHRLRHPYIVNLNDVVFNAPRKLPSGSKHRNTSSKKKRDPIFMVFEKGDGDLEQLRLPFNDLVACIVHTLLAYEYLHLHNILHRDGKPNNLIWFEKTKTCKLIDFGLCKPTYKGDTSSISIVVGPYRAPELWMGKKNYDGGVDIWALGMSWLFCLIQDELVVVEKNDNLYEPPQALASILSSVPHSLTKEQLEDLKKEHKINTRKCVSTTWDKVLSNCSEEYVPFLTEEVADVLSKMLEFYPENRWTAGQLLDHPYFQEFRPIIEKVRAEVHSVPSTLSSSYLIHVQPSPERDIMKDNITFFLTGNKYIELRTIFHAMDIFDRYILYRVKNQEPRPNQRVSQLRFLVCLYLSYKYFSIRHSCNTIEEVLTVSLTDKEYDDMENFETRLVMTILNREIYRPTLYEMYGGNQRKLEYWLKAYFDVSKIRGIEISLNEPEEM
jgi:serine/threonine protein kinase